MYLSAFSRPFQLRLLPGHQARGREAVKSYKYWVEFWGFWKTNLKGCLICGEKMWCILESNKMNTSHSFFPSRTLGNLFNLSLLVFKHELETLTSVSQCCYEIIWENASEIPGTLWDIHWKWGHIRKERLVHIFVPQLIFKIFLVEVKLQIFFLCPFRSFW